MRALRVGVIGVGALGQHHARIYAGMPEVKLVGVADRIKARAAGIADRYHCLAVTDIQALIDQVEAVSVAVPTRWHYAVTRQCLEAGVHVLVEKPITATVDEADELVRIASARAMTLQVGHIERFNPALRAALGAIKRPKLIECRRWAPYTSRGADVDVVLDLMIHDLDIALSLSDSPVRDIQAHGVTLISPTTDVANARVLFQNGCAATFSVSRVAEVKVREIRLFDDEGFIAADLIRHTARIGRCVMGTGGSRKVILESLRGDAAEPLQLELQAFVESIRTGTAPLVSGREGAVALRLASCIIEQIILPQRLTVKKIKKGSGLAITHRNA
jgi:predicted dehydrogenase